ncbi:MAG: radical SAM protein [Elusimicrobiota bacterium]
MGNYSNYDLENCTVCPVECHADRLKNRGECGAGDELKVASWNLHHGEEPPISGTRGSGTIFFSHCSLKCSFCQNYPISHFGNGTEFSYKEVINIMLKLQSKGAHNINLVTPTHYTPHLIKILKEIKGKTLKIPVVYNCGGYEKVETLKKLEGLVDIYMPDAKFGNNKLSQKICGVRDYFKINKMALEEMYRQVGNFEIDKEGIAVKGLLIRHLVLPGYLKNSRKILKFLAEKFQDKFYLSLMAQYHPAYKVLNYKYLGRRLTKEEYKSSVSYSEKLELDRGYFQKI